MNNKQIAAKLRDEFCPIEDEEYHYTFKFSGQFRVARNVFQEQPILLMREVLDRIEYQWNYQLEYAVNFIKELENESKCSVSERK